MHCFTKDGGYPGKADMGSCAHTEGSKLSKGKTARAAELCARQLPTKVSCTSSSWSCCRNCPGAPVLRRVTPSPRHPQGGSEKTYDVSVHILARSVSLSVRTATTTDTNWFSCCHAAEVTRTTWAQTRSLPLSSPPRSWLGTLAGTVCLDSQYCHDVCDACW